MEARYPQKHHQHHQQRTYVEDPTRAPLLVSSGHPPPPHTSPAALAIQPTVSGQAAVVGRSAHSRNPAAPVALHQYQEYRHPDHPQPADPAYQQRRHPQGSVTAQQYPARAYESPLADASNKRRRLLIDVEEVGVVKQPAAAPPSRRPMKPSYLGDDSTGFEDDGTGDDWSNVHKSAVKRPQYSVLDSRQNEAAQQHSSDALHWEVMWRNQQNKKNKTWEQDGYLEITGVRARLVDKETRKTLGAAPIPGAEQLQEDDEIKIGSRDVQLQKAITLEEFLKGSGADAGVNGRLSPQANKRSLPAAVGNFYGPPKSKTAKTGTGFRSPFPASVVRPSAYRASAVGLPPPPAPVQAPKRLPLMQNEMTTPIRAPHFPPVNRAPVTPIANPASHLGSKVNSSSTVSAGTFYKSKDATKEKPEPKPLFDPSTKGAVVMRRPDEDHSQVYNKKGAPIVDVVLDPALGLKLRQHQREGVQFMYECVMGMRTEGQGCILADEMGLGKTIQSIALLYMLLKQNPYAGTSPVLQKALIVCPVTLVKNWTKEFYRWLGKDRIPVHPMIGNNNVRQFVMNKKLAVMIIGYEKLRNVVDELKSIQPPIGIIICDEGHRLKSAGAKTTMALHELPTKRRVILSGTPIQNELSEYHAMIDFVNPGLLDNYQVFKKTFEQPILRGREPGAAPDVKELGDARNESLTRITSHFILRRTADVISGYLPPKAEYVVFVAPTPVQVKIYQHVLGSRELKYVFNDGASALGLITLLRKVCNTPGLLIRDVQEGKNAAVADTDLVNGVVSLIPKNSSVSDERLSGKLNAVKALLKEIRSDSDEKVVLVSNFTSTLDILEDLCRRSKFSYCRLDGKTKQNLRQGIVDEFNRCSQDHKFVFLLSSKSGGTGLNIIGASRLILFDSDWNPSNDLQAMARIHRDGQKRPCVIYRILTTGAMDEKIYQRQIKKQGLAGSLMDGGKTSAGGSKNDAFTAAELRDIFTLHLDTPCQTHDLLGCSCDPTAVTELSAESSGTDDEEEGELPDLRPRIMLASQYDPDKATRKSTKTLAALKEWTHINCQTDDDRFADCIEDEILREVVLGGLANLRRTEGYARQAREQEEEEDDDDEDSDDDRSGLVHRPNGRHGERKDRPDYQGGEISYIFHKNAATLPPTSGSSTASGGSKP